MNSAVKNAQVRLNRTSSAHWQVILDNPPVNLMGAEFVLQLREIVAAIEADERLKLVTSWAQDTNDETRHRVRAGDILKRQKSDP